MQYGLNIPCRNIKDVHYLEDGEKLILGSINENFVDVWGVKKKRPVEADRSLQSLSLEEKEPIILPPLTSAEETQFPIKQTFADNKPTGPVSENKPITAQNKSRPTTAKKFQPGTARFEYIPTNDGSKPLNLDLAKFLKQSRQLTLPLATNTPIQSESDVIDQMLCRHTSMMTILSSKLTHIQTIRDVWQEENIRDAIDQLSMIKDSSVLVDILRIIALKPKLLTLELSVLLLPLLCELLFEIYEE